MTDLPFTFDPVSNGEYVPPPKDEATARLERAVRRQIDRNRRRSGLSRRDFLLSGCAMATTLGVIGGCYSVPPEAGVDPAAAQGILKGKEFIFDVQSHHVMPDLPWRKVNPEFAMFLRMLPAGNRGEKDVVRAYSRYWYTKEIFLDSDTTCAVLSALPATPEGQPLPIKDAFATEDIVNSLSSSRRLAVHGLVTPNVGPIDAQMDAMEKLAKEHKISAWKVYTLWAGPQRKGFWLDDEKIGIPMIEKGRSLGIKIVCTHKGIPLWGNPGGYDTPRDVGVVARRFPDVTFIVYHSGYDPGIEEGPYDEARSKRGINALVKTLQENGIRPNSNVYAELGSTWWMLMKKPEQAAHVIGKLLKHVGEDRVVWGTDSIWYGSPQAQIEAFRAFQIPPELREKHGYPELTPEIKAKIFGLNACVPYKFDAAQIRKAIEKDAVEKLKLSYRNDPRPSYATYGPKTRREFFSFLERNGGPG